MLSAMQGFVKANKPWLLQGVTCLAIVAVEAYVTYQGLMADDVSVHYKIARTCGAAIKVIALAAMVPLSRVTYTQLQNSAVGKYIALDKRIIDHKIFSTALISASLCHAAAHYFNNRHVYLNQSGITGIVMLGSITALPLVGLMIFKRFGTALRVHQVGVGLFLVAYLAHTPDYRLVKYALAASAPFGLDRLIEKYIYTAPTRIVNAELIPATEFMSIELTRPKDFQYCMAGQYALLSLKSLDKLTESPHPFTIAQINSDTIRLLIKRTGTWTDKLHKMVQEKHSDPIHGVISGPFGKTLLNHCFEQSLSLIGSGIGITPMMAMLDYILNAELDKLPKPVTLHIIQRKYSETKPCLALISKMSKEKSHAINSINLYLTRENPEFISAKQLPLAGFFSRKTRIHFSRPSMDDIVQTAEIISVCGSAEVVDKVNASARRLGVSCYNEVF